VLEELRAVKSNEELERFAYPESISCDNGSEIFSGFLLINKSTNCVDLIADLDEANPIILLVRPHSPSGVIGASFVNIDRS
jgi:cob(I)alamin adenosyltransferase